MLVVIGVDVFEVLIGVERMMWFVLVCIILMMVSCVGSGDFLCVKWFSIL